MAEKAAEFVEAWIEENIHATGYEPEGDASEAKEKAVACWAAADMKGISRAAIQKEVGDLVERMARAIESVNDHEVSRQVAKDKS